MGCIMWSQRWDICVWPFAKDLCIVIATDGLEGLAPERM